MKSKNLFILIPLILLTSCNFVVEPIPSYTDTIAISDIDGSNLRSLCEHKGEIPYFIPNLANPGEELILLDCTVRIDVMNLDGTERHTIIDSLGGIANFSADRSKMLLNKNGEIYMVNVEGTDLINLTNTPDIWETDPAFSPDNKRIVYSYSLNNGLNAYLVVKDLHIGQSIIIYELDLERDYKNVLFTHNAYQNNNQILYRLHLIDQSEEPQIRRYELHRFDMSTNTNEIIIDDMDVGIFEFTRILNQSLIKLEGKTILFDMKDLSIIREFPNTFFSTVFNFSQTAHYLTVGSLVYNIVNDVEYNVITERNDFNRDETKIIGIANRYYD